MGIEKLGSLQLQLQTLSSKYNEQKDTLSPSECETWDQLEGSLQNAIQEMEHLLQRNKQMQVSFLLNHDKSSRSTLDRTSFYSENSVFNNKMDRSGSFRLCPPMAHTSAVEYFKRDLPLEPLMISDGQILENLANLKRLADLQR